MHFHSWIHIFHVNSVSNAGGVGIYISDLLQFKQLTFSATFSGWENLWIEISCLNTDINYIIETIYRHPDTNANQFCDFLNEILTELNIIGHKQYFRTGDININTSCVSVPVPSFSQTYSYMLHSNDAINIINISYGVGVAIYKMRSWSCNI